MRVQCSTDSRDECNIEIIDVEGVKKIFITTYTNGSFCSVTVSSTNAKALGEELLMLAETIEKK